MPAAIFSGNNVKLLKNNLDLNGTVFTAADNQATPANITGLSFSNSSTRGFEAELTIVRGTTYANFKLHGIQKASDWVLSQEYTGDDTGVDFSITSLGQLQYTTTSTGSTATLKFSAVVIGT